MDKKLTESDVRYFVNSIEADHELTGWFTFAEDDNYTWAIVFGWHMPYNEEYGEDEDTEVYFEEGPDLAERIIATIPSWNREIQDFMKRYVGKYQE